MFHKIAVTPIRSSSPLVVQPKESTQDQPQQAPRLTLVSSPSGTGTPEHNSSALIDLVSISAHRCSSFLAEAAVLVLVLALLDRLMLKGGMEIGWVFGAISISLCLLIASIATDFSARRWLSRH